VLHQITIYHNILWSKYKGGIFSHLYSLCTQRGVDVSFVQLAETEDKRIGLGKPDLSYHRYPYRLLFTGTYEGVARWRRILALSADLIRNPSILVVLPGYEKVEYWGMLIVCVLMRHTRAVFCDSTVHDHPKHRWKEIAKRLFFRHCDGFFCYGSRSKEYIASYGVDEKKIIYRCQAAALPHDYSPAQVLTDYRANDGHCSDPKSFLYVGRLSVEKGLVDLLLAFIQVHTKLPSARLDVVGTGPLKDELSALAESLGLEQCVTFSGALETEQIAQLFVRSVALVLPSHSEPWGLVVNESLSYGCPVVVSDVCGCAPELVLSGVTGYTYPAGNVPALARAMFDVARLSADRMVVARNCLSVIAGYSPEIAASQMLDGCIRLLGRA
jgi:glycosyltransferase involved in cell wall biosynthesis